MPAPDFTSARWRKSTRSNAANACVEVASTQDVVGVRDTKEQGRGPILAFSRDHWTLFLKNLKHGSLDVH